MNITLEDVLRDTDLATVLASPATPLPASVTSTWTSTVKHPWAKPRPIRDVVRPRSLTDEVLGRARVVSDEACGDERCCGDDVNSRVVPPGYGDSHFAGQIDQPTPKLQRLVCKSCGTSHRYSAPCLLTEPTVFDLADSLRDELDKQELGNGATFHDLRGEQVVYERGPFQAPEMAKPRIVDNAVEDDTDEDRRNRMAELFDIDIDTLTDDNLEGLK